MPAHFVWNLNEANFTWDQCCLEATRKPLLLALGKSKVQRIAAFAPARQYVRQAAKCVRFLLKKVGISEH